jgi:uroporphyrinogen decarboxylase
MKPLTSRERFSRIFEHREPDRIALWDYPWPGTLRRWQAEGMPLHVSFEDYFGFDKVGHIVVDPSPRYPAAIIEEDATFITATTEWGATVRNFKNEDSTPEFLHYSITNPDAWREAKKRMTPDVDRIPWDYLNERYPLWRREGAWITADIYVSFDHFHSSVVGTDTLCIALLEDPEWCREMFNHCLDLDLVLLDMAWDAGYTFDMINLSDDLGYKQSQFFSLDTYRDIIKPIHRKIADWAHRKGIKMRLHSCGYIMPFIADFIDAGIDCLNPMEVKAGMDPVLVKRMHGKDLVLHGGIDALLWKDLDAVAAAIGRLIPILKENGGYIFATDHSIPNDASLNTVKRISALVNELGSY